MNDQLNTETLAKIKSTLANHLGIDPEDIGLEDTFLEDLHMRPSDFSDFLEELGEDGLRTSELDLSLIKTVEDLVEALSSHEYLG